jgi:hypothetical protein
MVEMTPLVEAALAVFVLTSMTDYDPTIKNRKGEGCGY